MVEGKKRPKPQRPPGALPDEPQQRAAPPSLEPEASGSDAAEQPELPLERLERERDGLLDDLRRVQADFENFRKRMLREQTAQIERAGERLIEELLPVLDSFELALLNVVGEDFGDAGNRLRKGVELVYSELLGALEKAGLERIDALGKPFDPGEHEAVIQEAPRGGEEPGEPTVVDVMRTGYRRKGRVLRPAMVKVAR